MKSKTAEVVVRPKKSIMEVVIEKMPELLRRCHHYLKDELNLKEHVTSNSPLINGGGGTVNLLIRESESF